MSHSWTLRFLNANRRWKQTNSGVCAHKTRCAFLFAKASLNLRDSALHGFNEHLCEPSSRYFRLGLAHSDASLPWALLQFLGILHQRSFPAWPWYERCFDCGQFTQCLLLPQRERRAYPFMVWWSRWQMPLWNDSSARGSLVGARCEASHSKICSQGHQFSRLPQSCLGSQWRLPVDAHCGNWYLEWRSY